MNITRWLLGSTKGAVNEQTAIPGKFGLRRGPKSPRGGNEQIFARAELALIMIDHAWYLHVQPISQPDVEDEFSEIGAERMFLIGEELRISYAAQDDATVVFWRDLEGDDGDCFEFVCDKNLPAASLKEFDKTARKVQFSRKYGRESTSDAELEEFDFDEIMIAQIQKQTAPSPHTEEDEDFDDKVGFECELYVFDAEKGIFRLLEEHATATLQGKNLKHQLLVHTKSGQKLANDLDNLSGTQFSVDHLAFMFTCPYQDNDFVSFSLRFTSQSQFAVFESTFNKNSWESVNGKPWASVDEDDQLYIAESMRAMDVDSESEDQEDSESGGDEEDEVDHDNMVQDTNWQQAFSANSALEIGQVNDRAYVVRGDKIGVFKTNEDSIDYSTTISGFKTLDGGTLDPFRLMLHEEDRALVVQNRDRDEDTLYKMDLETGKIVEEWKAKSDIKAYAPVSKTAQGTAERMVGAVSKQSMFKIDPRLSGDQVVQDFTYMSRVNLNSLATDSHGYVVVGSRSGELRLHNKFGTRAVTLLPSLGDPIFGVDISADGEWLVATCESYLLLVRINGEENYFKRSAKGSRDKPTPIRLQISPSNATYMRQATQKPISFKVARFNSGTSVKDQSIVTATGPYLVSWDLAKVLRKAQNPYMIRRYDSDVTAENFLPSSDRRMVVTLKDDVGLVSKSALRRPTKQELLPQ